MSGTRKDQDGRAGGDGESGPLQAESGLGPLHGLSRIDSLILDYMAARGQMREPRTPQEWAGRLLWFRKRGWRLPRIPWTVPISIHIRALELVNLAINEVRP